MGKPGAKKLDQIVSVTPGDVHIIMVPSPGGPVPTPIPHPCNSLIKDKVADKVKVMGQPGATKGSISQHTPPHIPMGPGPFQKPPANKGEIVTASSNVYYQGKEAAMLGDTGKMCADPTDAPVGRVVGTAATVLVGGGGGGSGEARAKAADESMKAAAAECHKWINANMPPGAEREQAHRDVCTATGHPIDVATGKMFTRHVDLKLPGRIPFEFSRNYSSARSDVGVFGHSWRHSFEHQLIVHHKFVAHRDPNGRFLSFEPLAVGEMSTNILARLTLTRKSDGYVLKQADGLKQFFPFKGTPGKALIIPLKKIYDGFGNSIKFRYDQTRLSRITDTAGRKVHLDYGEEGFIRALRLVVGSDEKTLRVFKYSEEGDLIEVIDALGNPYTFQYQNHLLVRETNRDGFSFNFTYDDEGWCRETWGDGGLFYRGLEYDRHRQVTRATDSLGYITTYYWNDLGVVVREEDHEGNAWSFDFNERLQQTRAEDPLGNTWTYEYDEAGRLIAGEEPDEQAFAFVWGEDGRLLSRTDRGGHEWTLEYVKERRETVITDPQGRQTHRQQNTHGDVVSVRTGEMPASKVSYDKQGNRIEEKLPTGLVIKRTYNATGDLLSEADQYGSRLEIEYDEERRRTRIWDRQHGEHRYIRNREGQVTLVVDAKGGHTEFEWANFNRVSKIIYPAVSLSGSKSLRPSRQYEFDTENRVVKTTLPGGDEVCFDYGQGRRPYRIRFADGRVQEFERNARGHCTRFLESGHLVFDQETDAWGRVLRRTAGDGEEESYEYDEFGRLMEASNNEGTIQVDYDELGRITAERGISGELRLTYDPEGRLQAYQWDETLELEVHHRELGQRSWQQRHHDQGVDLTFDARGRLTQTRFSSGEIHEQEFGNLDLPVQRAIYSPVREREIDLYDYDEAGLLERNRSNYRPDRSYIRDAHNRLTEVVQGEGSEERHLTWKFDRAGNRIQATDLTGNDYTQLYTAGNKLVAVQGERLSYDERGRLIERTEADGKVTHYRWNALGRLTEVELPNGETVGMRYDALGRRIEKCGPEGRTRFAWRGKRLIHEWQGEEMQRHYLYHGDSFRPMASFEQNGQNPWKMYTFACDPRGCPESVGGSDGQAAWQATVAPWGETAVQQDNGFVQNLGMPGQYHDRETGLFYNFSRYYFPHAGSFLSPDPVGLSGGDNPYAYAADPVCFTDPLGLTEEDYDADVVRIYHGTVDQELLDATGGFSTKDRYGGEGVPPFVCVTTDRAAGEDAIGPGRQYSRQRHYAEKKMADPSKGPTRVLHEGSMSEQEWDDLHAGGHLTTNDYSGMNGGVPGSTETKARTPEGVAALNRAFGFPGEEEE